MKAITRSIKSWIKIAPRQRVSFVIPVIIACFASSPWAQAVSPPPDGGYPNFTTAEGENALLNLTTGSGNTAVGSFSLESLTGGSFNTGIGAGTLVLNTGDSNTATGAAALLLNTTGTNNTANGTAALVNNATGEDNTAVGAFALNSNTASSNTATGSNALLSNTSGNDNTAIGASALQSNTTAVGNTAVGSEALVANTTGALNTVVGAAAMPSNTIGNDNTAVGPHALFSNTEGNNNTALGRAAMEGNTTGVDNTAIGFFALAANTTAQNNTAVGFEALKSFNGIVGFNTAVGANALSNATTGDNNTAIGDGALSNLTAGLSNIAIGLGAGSQLTTGIGNVFIGIVGSVPGEDSHTYIRNIDTDTVAGANVTVDLATGRIGHAASSKRYKEEIAPMNNASEMLYRLTPVTFRYKKEINRTQSLEYGLIAEDVAEVDPDLAIRDGKGRIESVRYDHVNAMLLNEFLKEHRKVQELEATVVHQQKSFARQQAQIEALASGLQKVSAELEISRPAPQVASLPAVALREGGNNP